jgi:hypothetical protein
MVEKRELVGWAVVGVFEGEVSPMLVDVEDATRGH